MKLPTGRHRNSEILDSADEGSTPSGSTLWARVVLRQQLRAYLAENARPLFYGGNNATSLWLSP